MSERKTQTGLKLMAAFWSCEWEKKEMEREKKRHIMAERDLSWKYSVEFQCENV